jgi:hypothetical protein
MINLAVWTVPIASKLVPAFRTGKWVKHIILPVTVTPVSSVIEAKPWMGLMPMWTWIWVNVYISVERRPGHSSRLFR